MPLPARQTVNRGEYTCDSFLVCTRTVTGLVTLVALQTQIAKLAVCPARTWAGLVNGWTRTHRCGVVGVGLVDLLGLGDGVAVLVGVLVGAGLDLGGLVRGVGLLLGVTLRLGLGLADLELLALGLGLVLADLELLVLGLGLLGGSDVLLLVGLGCGLAEVVLVLLGGALADRLAVDLGLAVRFDAKVSALSRSAVFGRLAHPDGLPAAAGCAVAALASVTPAALEEQTAKPVKAPSTASRTSRALTCPTSPRLTFRLRTWSTLMCSPYAWPG